MTFQSMAAARTVALLFISGWMLHSGYGIAVNSNNPWSRFISLLKDKAREQWRPGHDDLVSVMSVSEAVQSPEPILPNLPTLAGQLGLNSLVADFAKAGLTQELLSRGPLTVLGPSDAAFDTVPDWMKRALQNATTLLQVLQFHVLEDKLLIADITDELTARTLQGQRVRFNVYPNNVTTGQCALIDEVTVNKMASNGVLQELKQVMRPPHGNLLEVASACPVFKTLATSVQRAGLNNTLNDKGPFTLFAPTDAAFQKLDPQTRDKLMNNITALTDLLKYHVADKTFCSAGLVYFGHLNMLNGEQVNITIDTVTVRVNDAAVIPSGVDGSVSNGVMHAIDAVLIPPSLQQQLLGPSSSQAKSP